MALFHTPGAPPSRGNANRATIGCTRNSRKLPTKITMVNSPRRASLVGKDIGTPFVVQRARAP